FVSISGDVNKPGVYEVPFGQTVRELVFDLAGGLRDGQKLKAIAPSGPSGGFLPAQLKVENLTEKFVKERVPCGAMLIDILHLRHRPGCRQPDRDRHQAFPRGSGEVPGKGRPRLAAVRRTAWGGRQRGSSNRG